MVDHPWQNKLKQDGRFEKGIFVDHFGIVSVGLVVAHLVSFCNTVAYFDWTITLFEQF